MFRFWLYLFWFSTYIGLNVKWEKISFFMSYFATLHLAFLHLLKILCNILQLYTLLFLHLLKIYFQNVLKCTRNVLKIAIKIIEVNLN